MDIPPHPGEMALGAQPEQRLTPAARHWDERRVQLLTRAWPHADHSWADAGCAHSSTSATTAGLGGLMILPNPSLRLKPRGINVSNPPGTQGISSRHQLTGYNGLQWADGHGAPRELQATARDHCAPARREQAHPHIILRRESSAALQGRLPAIKRLQAVGSGQKRRHQLLGQQGNNVQCLK